MSGSAIPASQIVSVVPSVLNAGGVGLDLNGLMLTTDQHIPLGEVYSFPDLTSVQSFFGPTSYISMLAGTYFLADINATKRPGALLISSYTNNQWTPAWLMGAQIPTLTLPQLQSASPNSTFGIYINGVYKVSQPFSLSTAKSFSEAAMMVGGALHMTDGFQISWLTASFAGGVMTVTANTGLPPWNNQPNGVAVGYVLAGAGIPIGTYITGYISGDGLVGTWRVNKVFTLASTPNIRMYINPCTWDAQTSQFRIETAPAWAAVNPSSLTYVAGKTVSMSHMAMGNGNAIWVMGLVDGSRLNPYGVGYDGYPFTTTDGFMDGILKVTTNWATFMHAWEPDYPGANDQRQQFAAWANKTQNNYMYCCWDTDSDPTITNNATDSLGRLLHTSLSSGTAPIYSPNATNGRNLAMFMMGSIASIDFNRLNGRKTIAFRGQTGITPDVISGLVASNLEANFYNYYGIWTTANDQFRFMYPGLVSGPYRWIDSYVNQIWMNNAFQLALMELLTQSGSIPYNQTGYTMIKAACQDVINAAVNFGAIRPGVTLSEAQVIEVNNMAGVRIDGVLNAIGYHLQVLDANPQVRANRGTPPCTFWYMDGGSIQRLTLASVMVQ